MIITIGKKENDGHHQNIDAEKQNCWLIMMHLHDKGGAPVQSVHKLYEKPLLLPSVQDLHNLCLLLKQYQLIP